MLQKIRDKTQGLIAGLIIGAICVTFALWGVHYYLQGIGGGPNYAAKVNGQVISPQQFTQAYNQAQQQQTQALSGADIDSPSVQALLKQQVMQQMVDQTVLTSNLLKKHYRVSSQDVQQLLLSIPVFQENGEFSVARFNQVMQTMSYSQREFYQQLQDQLLIGQLALGLTSSNYALPLDIKAAAMLLNETRDIGFMVLPLQKFAKQVSITDEQIKTYYQQHQQQFKTLEQIQLQYIQLPASASSDQSDELANLTYENPSTLAKAAQKIGLSILSTPFFTAQTENGQGILASKEVRKMALSNDVLNEGYNSDLITLDDGSKVVIRVAARKPSTIMPLSEVNEKIKALLTKQQAQVNMKNLGNVLAQQLVNQSEGGAALAAQHQLTWHEKQDVNRHQQGIAPQVLQTVFSMYVPKDRFHPTTQTIMLANGDLAVVAFYQAKYGDVTKLTPDQMRIFSQKIADDYGQADYALYVRSLKKQSKIKINQSIVNDSEEL